MLSLISRRGDLNPDLPTKVLPSIPAEKAGAEPAPTVNFPSFAGAQVWALPEQSLLERLLQGLRRRL